MKILITCHSYYPRKDGVQFVTQYLAEGLAKKGHKVTVYTIYHPEDTKLLEEIHNDVKIKRIIAYTKHTIHHGEKEKYIQSIIEESKKNDIMINVCTQCATTDWILDSLDKIKIPKILYLHSIWNFKYNAEDFTSIRNLISKIWCNIRWKIYYKTNKCNFKKYDLVTQLHNMDYSYKFFKVKYDIDCEIVENAAENDFFKTSLDNTIELPQNYILNVSNYLKRKNQEKLLKLFFESEISDKWELILIGSHRNAYYDKLEKIYDKYRQKGGLKKVRLLYNIPREDIPTYVKKAKIYLMTSKWEAFPISLVESIAAGVPFISSNVGIVKYLPGGVVCNKDEEYKFWLNEFCLNENVRICYGKLGSSIAKDKYSIESKVNKVESFLKQILENKK